MFLKRGRKPKHELSIIQKVDVISTDSNLTGFNNDGQKKKRRNMKKRKRRNEKYVNKKSRNAKNEKKVKLFSPFYHPLQLKRLDQSFLVNKKLVLSN